MITRNGDHPGRLTRAEIFQQPELWPTTLERVRDSGIERSQLAESVLATGAGTSAYAATALANSWPGASSAPTTDLLVASPREIKQRFPHFVEHCLLISLGRSGESPESIAVVQRVQRFFPAVEHLAITCNGKGRLANLDGVRRLVLDPRTNDQSLAMTSSFSNLVLAGLCLQGASDLKSAIPKVSQRVREALPQLDASAAQISKLVTNRVAILASGPLRAMVCETSLKILEMTAGEVTTLAETFLGLRHGPMSFLRPDTVVICFLSSLSERRCYEEDLIRELRQKHLGFIVAITPEHERSDLFDFVVPANAPHLADEWRVPFEIPFAQLLAYHLSRKMGLDPDNPSPTGAITRVVQESRTHENYSNV